MPKQPGVHVFALPDRPKQTRRRQKKAPGASDATKTKSSSSSRSSTRKLGGEPSTSTASSSIGSSSSGSFSGVGPIRNTRQRRARETNDHYGSWLKSADEGRSPLSTEGAAETPESFGSPPLAGPPARRNAISDGFSPSIAVAYHSPSSSIYNTAEDSSSYEDFDSLNASVQHGMSHRRNPSTESLHVANIPFADGYPAQSYSHSLASVPNDPYTSNELSIQAFNSTNNTPMFPPEHTNGWANGFFNTTQLQNSHPQALNCFPASYFGAQPAPMAGSGIGTYSELEPLQSAHSEYHVPGEYPFSSVVDASEVNANQIYPTICVEDFSVGSPSGHYSSLSFALPNE